MAARWIATLVGLVGAFVFVASSNAAFVSRTGNNNFALLFSASAGETNNVVLTFADNVFTVTDTAVVTASSYCDQVDEHTVTCVRDAGSPTNTPIWQVIVDLEDGNDSAWTDVPYETELNGGTGDDSMTYLGDVIGSLFGEDGNDTLTTADGEDALFGGAGNDVVSDGAGPLGRLIGGDGDDVLHGGGGRDCLGGAAGVDSLSGGLGNDTLKGDAGNDSLHGNDGNDVLMGAGGHDVMSGGSGKDGFAARDNLLDKLRGGTGIDRAFVDPGLDRKKSIENVLSGRQSFSSITQCSFPFLESLRGERMPLSSPVGTGELYVSFAPRTSVYLR